ncbi:MAG: hypothetical protein AAF688_02345 [Bacteroidota bacterium]
MKAIITFLSMSLFLFSCQERTEDKIASDSTTENKVTLEGAWELIGYYNYADNMVTDSFASNKGQRQIKMYTASKVMWSKSFPLDSAEWFGYGSYKLDGEELTEVLDYGSEVMNRIMKERKEFVYKAVITDKTFSQIEIDEDGNKIYAENYRRIE